MAEKKESSVLIKFKELLYILAGTALFSLAVHVFTAPNNIAPGGVTGLATVLNYITKIPIGTITLLANLPLLLLGLKFLGKSFLWKTLASTLAFTFYTDFAFVRIPVYRGNIILAALYGGILTGMGLAISYLSGGSTGGTDITNRILQKRYPFLKLGTVTFITDCIVIGVAAVVYRDIEAVLAALIALYLGSWVMDKILYGLDTGKLVFIVTSQKELLSQKISNDLKRGNTIIPAVGGYSSSDRDVLMVAVRKNEFYKLKKIINDNDPMAFFIQTDASEVFGEGFKRGERF